MPVAALSWLLLVYRAWSDSRDGTPLRLPFIADLAEAILEKLD